MGRAYMRAEMPVSALTSGLDLEEELGSGFAGFKCQPLTQGSISSTDELRMWEQGCQGRSDREPVLWRRCRALSAYSTE